MLIFLNNKNNIEMSRLDHSRADRPAHPYIRIFGCFIPYNSTLAGAKGIRGCYTPINRKQPNLDLSVECLQHMFRLRNKIQRPVKDPGSTQDLRFRIVLLRDRRTMMNLAPRL